MKSKVILLAFTFMLAAAMTSFTSKTNKSSQIGYWDNPFIPGIQSGIVYCSPFGSSVNCLQAGFQVYCDPVLTIPLHKDFN